MLNTKIESSLNNKYQLVATLTKSSESITIDKSMVKQGFVMQYGETVYIPKDLCPYNGNLLHVSDSSGYTYGTRIGFSVTLQDDTYTIKLANQGFYSCFANNQYSRPTSGFSVRVYAA